MSNGEQFPYVAVKNSLGEIATRPLLPATLAYRGVSMEVNGLLDTGSDVNVLPYQLGLQLGGTWEQARTGLRLSGNLAHYEARGILVTCTVVRLAFGYSHCVCAIAGAVSERTRLAHGDC